MLRVVATVILAIWSFGMVTRSELQKSSADHVLRDAERQAVSQRKKILLVFGASWCEPCREFDAFLDDQKIRSVLVSHFAIARLTAGEEVQNHPELNSPGAEDLMVKFGGATSGLPFTVVLDAKGNMIINSNRPVKGTAQTINMGYPSKPAGIPWFMLMLRKGAPSLSESELRMMEEWLLSHPDSGN
jgi:thioredoxin-related protein